LTRFGGFLFGGYLCVLFWPGLRVGNRRLLKFRPEAVLPKREGLLSTHSGHLNFLKADAEAR
jgi:hypothetical protein